MLELGVNIDHVATLRQQRGTHYPDPVFAAQLAEKAGVDVITLHLREDRRHIQDRDVAQIRATIQKRINLECAITDEMLAIACQTKPDDVCLVPERREELTTEGGLDIIRHFKVVQSAVQRLADHGIRTSLFIDPDAAQIEAAHQTGARVIELHTGAYAEATPSEYELELERIQTAAQVGQKLGVRVNAGHGLSYQNVVDIAIIPEISELNIGHAMVAQAIYDGWVPVIYTMRALLYFARTDKVMARRFSQLINTPSHSANLAAYLPADWSAVLGLMPSPELEERTHLMQTFWSKMASF